MCCNGHPPTSRPCPNCLGPLICLLMSEDIQIVAKRSPIRRLPGVQIISTGSFLPDQVVTNEALASLGCDAEWIIQRTGIRERRHAPPQMSTGDIAIAAAERCIESAKIDRGEI